MTPTQHRPDRTRAAGVLVAVAAATVVAHLTLLGWHRLQQYETWRVWVLVLVLAALVAAGTWLRMPLRTCAAVSVSATAVWCTDAATDSSGDGASLWPVGGLSVFVAAVVGGVAVGALVDLARRQTASRR